jgi:hypothetical protein
VRLQHGLDAGDNEGCGIPPLPLPITPCPRPLVLNCESSAHHNDQADHSSEVTSVTNPRIICVSIHGQLVLEIIPADQRDQRVIVSSWKQRIVLPLSCEIVIVVKLTAVLPEASVCPPD